VASGKANDVGVFERRPEKLELIRQGISLYFSPRWGTKRNLEL
jgi:hypothetical protein